MKRPRIIVICQARMSSSRLPGKVLLPLAGEPLLLRCVQRIRRATLPTEVVVATSIDGTDDVLVDFCITHGIPVTRGSMTDLLDRHVTSAQQYHADVVVKIPSDCPLIDPAVIDSVIGAFLDLRGAVDYVSNLHPPSWPDGQDVEVMSIDVLEMAARTAHKPYEREHTTPWLWDANPNVRCSNVLWPSGRDLSMTHRWTIDYPEDYEFIRTVYDRLFTASPDFGVEDILQLLEHEPDVHALNASRAGVNWYRHHLDDLQTITPRETRQA